MIFWVIELTNINGVCRAAPCLARVFKIYKYLSIHSFYFKKRSKSYIRHKDFRLPLSILNAQDTLPGFWNLVDWRALVKDYPLQLAKLRELHCFMWDNFVYFFYFLTKKKWLFKNFEIFSEAKAEAFRKS